MSTKTEGIAGFQRTTGPIFLFKYKSQMTGSNITNQILQVNPAQKVQAHRQSDCQTPALIKESVPANDRPTVAVLQPCNASERKEVRLTFTKAQPMNIHLRTAIRL